MEMWIGIALVMLATTALVTVVHAAMAVAYRRGYNAGINAERLMWSYENGDDDPEPEEAPVAESTEIIDLFSRRKVAA